MKRFFSFLLRSLSIFGVATRRLLAQRGLALATAIGLIVSVAIVMSIPLYSDAVYYSILQKELTQINEDTEIPRPPFAFMFRYVGSLYGLMEWEDIEPADVYLMERAPGILRLPHEQTVRYFRTDNFRLFPAEDVAYADVKDPLAWINFATASNIIDHITLLEGAFPAVADAEPESIMEVLLNEAMANELGLQVGETFFTFRRVDTETDRRSIQVPIRISGIWRATDPAEAYWFYRQTVFDNQFFIPEESFRQRLVPLLSDEIAQALWYIILDGDAINSSDVGWILSRINTVQQQVGALLPNTRLEVSPQEALARYRRSSRLLNILLYAFSIPIVGLLLAFIGLVVGLSVGRQRNEIAVLRSRGATVFQVLGIAILEAFLLGAVAFIAGMPVSQQITQLIGATRSFLDFTQETDLRITVTMATLRFGFAALAVTLVAQVVPSFGAARHTIVSYKREQARTIRPPWWQRAWLDILLLIPVLYGTYLLEQQGSIAMPGSTGLSNGPFDNPLLFLLPAMGALALTLVVLRILPLIMRTLSWIAGKSNSVGFLLATRYLARDSASYNAPLVLLILTLSLSTYTASLAQTLDNHLFDQNYYKVGSDAMLAELGRIDDGGTGAAGGVPGGDGAPATATTGEGADAETIPQERWVFIPISEHLKIPEINAAARVGDFKASMQLQGRWQESRFLGVDRLDFPKTAFWRRDFASASLGGLMNALAVAPEGILLPRKFMRENAIIVGDHIPVRISSYGLRAEMNALVVGELEYFPTWYPSEDEPLIVGNLENFFEYAGGELPYDVWINTEDRPIDNPLDYTKLLDDLRGLDLVVLNWRASPLRIAEEQRRPERQGLFGVLSVGFLAAAFLTVLGFFLYALFSFRRRFIELGTLRAIGLSSGQMTTFLAWELAFVILLGLGAGTLLGTIISDVYIPFLQVGANPEAMTPPFLVEIAWDAIVRIYVLFGGLFVLALSVLAVLLLRMKIFQAIKLGETV